MVKSVFKYLYFVRSYKHLQVPCLAAILDSGRTFKWEGDNVIHVLGLEFGEEHNGEVRFQISLFRKKLQAFTGSMLTVT